MTIKKKVLLPGQAGGLAILKKYGPDHFRNMALKQHRKRKRLEKLAKLGKK